MGLKRLKRVTERPAPEVEVPAQFSGWLPRPAASLVLAVRAAAAGIAHDTAFTVMQALGAEVAVRTSSSPWLPTTPRSAA